MTASLVHFFVLLSFVAGLAIAVYLLLIRHSGTSTSAASSGNTEFAGKSGHKLTHGDEAASSSKPDSSDRPTHHRGLLYFGIVAVCIIGLYLQFGIQVLKPWSLPELHTWAQVVLESLATWVLLQSLLITCAILAMFLVIRKIRTGEWSPESFNVFLGTFLVSQILFTYIGIGSFEGDTNKITAEDNLREVRMNADDPRRVVDLGSDSHWLPFEPNPNEVEIYLSTPTLIAEELEMVRAYYHANRFYGVLRFLSVTDINDTEDWDLTFFREFWRDRTCGDTNSRETLRQGGMAEFIAMAKNGDVIGRSTVTYGDCIEDSAKFENKVPLRQNNGVFYLKVNFTDSVFAYMVLDSGAADVFVPRSIADELIHAGVLSRDDMIEPGIYTLADGSSIEAQRFILKAIHVGDLEINDVVVAISESDDSVSLLGQSVLRELGRYSIDYQRQLLSF